MDNKVKVSCILNWLGDDAFLIYDNLTFAEPTDKDFPDKVLDAFSNYLKPERNVFHSWYMLGSIYSNQFKSQSDFYNHLQCVAKECNFSNSEEIVKFLFLTHNNNTHVCEDLLKEMKEDTSLATMLNIAWISEETIHSEELSKQYLDTIKVSNKQTDSVWKPRSKSGSRNKSCSTSHSGNCGNCGSKHPPRKCKAFGKKCHGCGKLNHFVTMCRSRNRSQSQSKGNANTNNPHATNKPPGGKQNQNQNQSQNGSHHDFYEVNNQDNFEFDYEQDSVTMVFNTQFRNRNVMFDEISSQPSLQQALMDLYVSDGSNGKTFHFKVDTGACGNLLPYNLYKWIVENKANMNYLCCTIDNSMNLVAFNKKIKQLGTCTLCVSCGPNTRIVKFFVVDSRLNPIIGLDDSHQLQLVKFNCPIHQSWTGQKCTNLNSFDSISGEISKFRNTIPSTLTKDWIVNHPKYRHLFKGIRKFNVPPVSITLKDNAQPIQKPPRKVLLAMKHPFK